MRLAAAVLAALLLPGLSSAAAVRTERVMRPMADGTQRPTEVVAGELFVRFAQGVDKQVAASAIGATILRDNPLTGWTLVQLPAGMTVAGGLQAFSQQLGVSMTEGNHVYRPNVTPNDPGVPSQYGLTRINAFTAWDYNTGDTGSQLVTVAVVDAGIEGTHTDLNDKLAGTSQFFDPFNNGAQSANNPPTAACNHGTRVASVAAAEGNNGLGIAGVGWGQNIKLLSLKVFNAAGCDASCGGGSCVTTDAALINAVDYAVTQQNAGGIGKIVINMSLGGAGACSAALRTSLDNAVTAGIPVIVAAGNDGGAVNEPANCATTSPGSGIIPVGASDSSDNIASFSSRGPELAANGVIAPGVGILVDDVSNGQASATASGTSFSAPHVAGAAALMLQANPNLTARQVQTHLRNTAANVGIAAAGSSSGGGRLDAGRAVRLAATGSAGSSDLDEKAVAYPNPFRPSRHGTVTLTIPRGEEGSSRTIKIFTMAGQLVRRLSGLTWDGRNEGGTLVASGTYLFSISLGDKVFSGRVAVIR